MAEESNFRTMKLWLGTPVMESAKRVPPLILQHMAGAGVGGDSDQSEIQTFPYEPRWSLIENLVSG
jgi:hypothetical protein